MIGNVLVWKTPTTNSSSILENVQLVNENSLKEVAEFVLTLSVKRLIG